MARIVTLEERRRILAEAEEGARVEARRRAAEIASRGGEVPFEHEERRVGRALEYAQWRIDAYEGGECETPW